MRRVTVTAVAAALALAGACGGDDDGATADDPGPVPTSEAAADTRPDTGPTGPVDAFCADFMAWAEEAAGAEVPAEPEEGMSPPAEIAPPEEIAEDWFAIDDEPLDTPEQIARAQRVDTWITENCGAIPGVTGTAEPGM
jgi:hypothetical protein